MKQSTMQLKFMRHFYFVFIGWFLFAGSASLLSAAAGLKLFEEDFREDWEVTDFFMHGDVRREGDVVVIGEGFELTGVTYTGDLPKMDYEVTLEAMKRAGRDFFCGLTFPFGDDFCTLIVGGWAGAVVGLSTVDGVNASENETFHFQEFEMERWYTLRLRVGEERIEAWIDDEQVIDLPTQGRSFDLLYGEIEKSSPFGIAAYKTTAALRNLRVRAIEGEEVSE